MPPTAAIAVSDLVVRYGSVTAVDRLSLSVAAGEIVALLGPNGAGKTTTVEALEGFRRPDAGAVRVLGLDPVRDRRRLVPRIGVMLQQGGVYPGIRPLEVLRLFAAYYDAAENPEALLERVGLTEAAGRTWRQLSGGEQQRLSLALALVGRPEVAFLDEPASGVDPGGRRIVREVVRELAEAGVAVLVTTHELDDAERTADRVVLIDRGRLIAAGTPAELTARGGGDEIRFGAAPGLDTAAMSAALARPVEEIAPGEYRVAAAATPTAVAALTTWLAEHDIALLDLRAGRQRLEDVFLRLTGDEHQPGSVPPGGPPAAGAAS